MVKRSIENQADPVRRQNDMFGENISSSVFFLDRRDRVNFGCGEAGKLNRASKLYVTKQVLN